MARLGMITLFAATYSSQSSSMDTNFSGCEDARSLSSAGSAARSKCSHSSLPNGFTLPAYLPVPLAQRPIGKDLPGEIVLVGADRICLAGQHGHPGFSEEGRQAASLQRIRIVQARDVEQRRHDIGYVHDGAMMDASFLQPDAGSTDNERVTNAALGGHCLVLGERRGRDLRPPRPIADERTGVGPRP